MYIIAIETTGANASAALIDENGVIDSECSNDNMNHLHNLIPTVDALLNRSGLSKSELSIVAVSEGPGSFTGIRIGMATAKGLAMALGTDMISVPTLKSFAYHEECRPEEILCCPLFDARRSQVYAGAYYWNKNGEFVSLVEDGAYELNNFFSLLKEEIIKNPTLKRCILYGDGVSVYSDRIQAFIKEAEGILPIFISSEEDRLQDAKYTAMMALEKYKRNELISIEEIEPVYLRKAEAQRKLEEAQMAAAEKDTAKKVGTGAGAGTGSGVGTGTENGAGVGAGAGNADYRNSSRQDSVSIESETNNSGYDLIKPSDITIRNASSEDIDEIENLDKMCFKIPWSRNSFESDINSNQNAIYLVAEVTVNGNTSIIGYAGIWCVLDEGQITNVAVHPECRKAGLGTRLVNELISAAESRGAVSQTLEVRESNRDAICLYKRIGFSVKGVRKKYYSDNGENALLMWRNQKTE